MHAPTKSKLISSDFKKTSQSASPTAPPEEEPMLELNFSKLNTNPSVGFADSSPTMGAEVASADLPRVTLYRIFQNKM